MAHILNLVGEDLVKDAYFHDAEVFTNDFKKAFKRQPKRKSCYQAHLVTTEYGSTALPPEPCQTRWGTWFDAVKYHRDHLDVYQTFFAEEDSDAMHIKCIQTTLEQDKKDLLLKMNFICDSSPKIQFLLTRREGNKPFAPLCTP